MIAADDLIDFLGLSPLPWEGGWYRETWRAQVTIPGDALPDDYSGPRSAGTAIYYLLTPDTVSKLHRLPSDETFHFYLGDPVEMLLLHPGGPGREGMGETIIFGHDLMAGERVQFTVPGHSWMGARLRTGGTCGYALMGTTVAPGFDFDDLEMADGRDIIPAYPEHAALIAALS
ncbi:MAG: cupin domain-containing protein [Rhodospirillales bacterium]